MPSQSTDTPTSPDAMDDLTFSRRGLGKRLLLGASALAMLLASGKRELVQAAPVTDPWKLGGNSGVTTTGSNFLGTLNVAPLIFKVTKTAGSAPTERMRITPGGTIGIGTTAPAGLLHAKLSSVAPALLGESLSTATGASGVLGKLTSTTPGIDSAAVRGVNSATNSNGAGVRGEAPDGYGVYGIGHFGVVGEADYAGVTGQAQFYGVRGFSTDASSGIGVYGQSRVTTNNGSPSSGVHGQVSGSGDNLNGVHGVGLSARNIGVRGDANGSQGTGVWGIGPSDGWAGYFSGRVTVTGTLSKGAGSFKIDHPLAPDTKYLYHSFVESPDMKNVYDGTITTDANGEATVELPEWFEALNRDFRYQLTVLGQFAQAIVAQEIADNRFSIKTDKPNVRVSWQVTGIRHDAFANANRIPVEEDKPARERGTYLHPKEHGKSESAGVDAGRIKQGQAELAKPTATTNTLANDKPS